jgi:hypothetical protein
MWTVTLTALFIGDFVGIVSLPGEIFFSLFTFDSVNYLSQNG